MGLLAMITRQMRNIFRIKALAGNRQRLRELGLHPYELKNASSRHKAFGGRPGKIFSKPLRQIQP